MVEEFQERLIRGVKMSGIKIRAALPLTTSKTESGFLP